MANNYIFSSLTLYEYANEEYMKMKSTYVLLLVSSLILVACDSKDKKALLLPLASVTGSQAQGSQGVPGVQITGNPGNPTVSVFTANPTVPSSEPENTRPSEGSTSTSNSSEANISCSLNNPGHSWGDPHLKTLDGMVYDFQGLGEYWLIRTSEGSGIQVRQVAWKSNKKVTVNTR